MSIYNMTRVVRVYKMYKTYRQNLYMYMNMYHCRTVLAAGRVGALPKLFSFVHVKYNTPLPAIILMVSKIFYFSITKIIINTCTLKFVYKLQKHFIAVKSTSITI